MKFLIKLSVALFLTTVITIETKADSLVRLSELSFKSDYEKHAFEHYLEVDELNLCLATNKDMTEEKAMLLKDKYLEIRNLLYKEKITPTNFRQKYAGIYKILFSKETIQSTEFAEFSDILNNNSYDYITATVLFSLVLKEMNFTSFFLLYPTKTNIIIEPNGDQIILEIPNKADHSGFYNVKGNKDPIANLLDKNIRFANQLTSNSPSVSTIIEKNDSIAIKRKFMAGTLYYYKSLKLINMQQENEALQLAAKACYLCPDQLFVKNYYTILNERFDHCEFKNVEDMDLMGQLSRFNLADYTKIENTFKKIISNKIINPNGRAFIKSAYKRLIPQLNDIVLANEISYWYYMTEAFYNDKERNNDATPIIEALKLKPNDKPALQLFNMKLNYMMYQTDNQASLLDSLNIYEKALSATQAINDIKRCKISIYLQAAKEYYMQNKPNIGEKYIKLFEESFQPPMHSTDFRVKIEDAYYEYARYYVRMNNRPLAKKIVQKGLNYIPKSNMIESATYNFAQPKPKITHKKMTKAEYEKYMKKGYIE